MFFKIKKIILVETALPVQTMPFTALNLPCPALPNLILPYITLPYLTLPYINLSYLTLHSLTMAPLVNMFLRAGRSETSNFTTIRIFIASFIYFSCFFLRIRFESKIFDTRLPHMKERHNFFLNFPKLSNRILFFFHRNLLFFVNYKIF